MNKATMKRKKGQAAQVDVSAADLGVTVTLAEEQGIRSASSSSQHSATGLEEVVRALAYRKWEAAACPSGDGIQFWLEAEQEVNAEPARSRPAQD